jgi:hypothetical protein
MIRNVIGDPHKFVKRQNGGAVPALDQSGGDRKVLVVRALSGSQFAAMGHCRLGAST